VLGELPRLNLDLLHGLLQRQLTIQVSDDLGITQRLSGLLAQPTRGGQERLHLVHQTGLDHRLHSGVDSPGGVFALSSDSHDDRGIAQRRRGPLLLLLAKRAAGGLPHLQGPLDPFVVVRVNSPGRFGIDLGQLRVQRRGPLAAGAIAQGSPEAFIRRRPLEHAVHQAHQVERRARQGQHAMPAAEDVGDCPVGLVCKAGDAERFRRLGHVDHVMLHARQLGLRRLGGADVHPAIDLHGVDAENLGVEPLGKIQ